MINIHIYLDSQKDAKQLVKELMESELLAHASIDKDNHSYMNINGKITEHTNFVITGQTKALLFDKIAGHVEKFGNDTIKLFSTPITQCNENFSEIIRKNTRKI